MADGKTSLARDGTMQVTAKVGFVTGNLAQTRKISENMSVTGTFVY